jgi:HAD superfamily hydrolase (TIGR01509 family)
MTGPGRLAGRGQAIEAVTLDFGNTLVPVSAAGLRGVVDGTARAMADRLGPFDSAEVLRAWSEERERQFREEVPQFREVDLAQRITRILARLRGMVPPAADERWDDEAAAAFSEAGEVAWAVETYSRAFVATLAPAPEATALLERLAGRYRLAVLSNWPLAATIDRYVEAAGWSPHLAAVVVSQRVGTIKPHPAIFAAARGALGSPSPDRIVHVGDDWAADVVGAKHAGWRACYLAVRPGDSPLPGSERDGSVTADLEILALGELPRALSRLEDRLAGR